MKTIFLAIFLALFLVYSFGCFKKTVEDKIVSHIEKSCKEFPCIIRIKEITDFNWDKMYVFDYSADVGEIEKVVGVYIPNTTRLTRKIIFTENGKVVSYDELPTNIENIVNNEIVFDNIRDYSYKIYTIENAVFEAQKYLSGDNTYYKLKQQDSEK